MEKLKPTSLRLASLPLEFRTTVYELILLERNSQNANVKAVLVSAIENQLRIHYGPTLGTEYASQVTGYEYAHGVLTIRVQRLQFSPAFTEHFIIEADLFSGENHITMDTK